MLVQHVFGHFKDYLSAQLDSQEKKLESKHKIDKDTVELKYKFFPYAVFSKVSDKVLINLLKIELGPLNSLVVLQIYQSLILPYTRSIEQWLGSKSVSVIYEKLLLLKASPPSSFFFVLSDFMLFHHCLLYYFADRYELL